MSGYLEKKLASLVKRYPNLKIRADIEAERIHIESKYGAGVQLDSYIYRDSSTWIWRLTAERKPNLRIDNIDKPYGRAFLKLCNKESF